MNSKTLSPSKKPAKKPAKKLSPSKPKPILSVKCVVPVVGDGELQQFLNALHGDRSGADRVLSYVDSHCGTYSNDSYHRVYVNDDYKINRRSKMSEDMPALKAALGIGDDRYAYFLLHCSW